MLFIALALAIGQVDLVDAAIAEVEKIPAERRPFHRFAYLDEFPEKIRDEKIRTFSGHVQSLSRETMITPVRTVKGTKSALIMFSIEDYGWPREVYEQLADADPWDHEKVEAVIQQAFPTTDVWKKYPQEKNFKYLFRSGKMLGALSNKTGKFLAWDGESWGKPGSIPPGPAAATDYKPRSGAGSRPEADSLVKLARLTNSRAPFLRMAWLHNQTAADENRKPGYYDFLGIKNQADFYKLCGFDPKKKRRKVEIRESTAQSPVNPTGTRAIIREQAEDRGLWRTLDFRKPFLRSNPLRNLGKDIDAAFAAEGVNDAATEEFGPLPNGWWVWFLGNNAGARQSTAPDFAATDYTSRTPDKKVHVGASCFRCHAEAGIQPIDAWTRNLFQPPLALASPDYKVFLEMRAQYLRRLEPFIALDRLGYEQAVLETTGWSAKIYAAKHAALWEYYEDAKVDMKWAARDLRSTPAQVEAAFAAYLKRTGQIDAILGALTLKGKRKQTVTIRQWEEVYPLARSIVYGVQK